MRYSPESQQLLDDAMEILAEVQAELNLRLVKRRAAQPAEALTQTGVRRPLSGTTTEPMAAAGTTSIHNPSPHGRLNTLIQECHLA